MLSRRQLCFIVFVTFVLPFRGGSFQPPASGAQAGPYRISLQLESGKSSFRVGGKIPAQAETWNMGGFPVECPEAFMIRDFSSYRLDLLSTFTGEGGTRSNDGSTRVPLRHLRVFTDLCKRLL
jgi:hypothetical protein